jgi:hypothetical protein
MNQSSLTDNRLKFQTSKRIFPSFWKNLWEYISKVINKYRILTDRAQKPLWTLNKRSPTTLNKLTKLMETSLVLATYLISTAHYE